MRKRDFVGSLTLAASFALVCFAEPGEARRRVIDFGLTVQTSDSYCSPVAAANPGGCSAIALPFAVQIGGQNFSSVYVNSNGVLSFGSIESYLAPFNSFTDDGLGPTYTGPPPATSLSVFDVPVFSPNFVDGPGFFSNFGSPQGYDGVFAATTSGTANSLTVNWFTCTDTVLCGPLSIDLVSNYVFNPDDSGLTATILSYATSQGDPQDIFEEGRRNYIAALLAEQNIYSLVLTDLSDGFMVDYLYSPAATGDVGRFGFNLPVSDLEQVAPLTSRRFVFDGLGQLVGAPVPEPGTWATMLLGFLGIGLAIRRQRARQLSWTD